MITNIGKAKAMQVAQRAAAGMGLDPTKARPEELVLFAKLDPNYNQYSFSLSHDEAIKVLTIANGLRDRDAFIAVGMALGIVGVKVASSVEYPSSAKVAYHPDPNIFSAAATSVLTEYEALRSLYWGTHTIQTNEGNRIDRAPNLGFLTVQQTQESFQYSTDGTNDSSHMTNNMNTGLEVKEIGAAVRFGGGDENRIIIDINCKDKSVIAGTATRANYVLIRLVGAIVKGSSTKQYLG